MNNFEKIEIQEDEMSKKRSKFAVTLKFPNRFQNFFHYKIHSVRNKTWLGRLKDFNNIFNKYEYVLFPRAYIKRIYEQLIYYLYTCHLSTILELSLCQLCKCQELHDLLHFSRWMAELGDKNG